MKEIIHHALLDTIKIVPFLFVAFMLLEYIEHKMNKKSKNILMKNQKYGPLLGSILGAFPQCGFSAMATNLYTSRVITIGTLIAIYLSTSDEMLPILISNGTNWLVIIKIIMIKVGIGLLFGFLIDFILRKKKQKANIKEEIHEMCYEEACHCEKGIFLSSLKHTLSITFFIFIVTILLNGLIHYIGEDKISNFLLDKNILSYFVSSLIGLIPNCASSVIITELYLAEMISLGSLIAGLLTGSGVGLLLLFRINKNFKENMFVLISLYLIGVISGFVIDLLGIII